VAIYLDYAASAPVRAVARDAYVAALAVSGNPSSIHRDGQRARQILEDARATLAGALSCDPIEVVFTSGGTESVNLGITGLFRASREADPRRVRIIVPEAEHHATVDTVEWLEKHEGAVLEWIPVDSFGRISLDAWQAALSHDPDSIALATCLWANNEVGTIQPVLALAKACEESGVPLHVDAVAAFGQLSMVSDSMQPGFDESHSGGRNRLSPQGIEVVPGITAMSVSGHKVGSVPGIGALFVSRTAKLHPLIHGGGQQRKLRSGTENPAAASSMAAAVQAAGSVNVWDMAIFEGYAGTARERILQENTGVTLSGDPTNHLATNIHIVVEGASSADMLYLLDEKGISVSAGSACQAGVARPSHVLLAMGYDEKAASGALRITFGYDTEIEDLEAFLEALPEVIAQARFAARLTGD
jgi:cysteine desulfurase